MGGAQMKKLLFLAAFGVIALFLGGGAASSAPTAQAAATPPFSLSPSPLSFSPGPRVGETAYADVTLTTDHRAVVIAPAAFGAGSPFYDDQRGTCRSSYEALGNKI